MKNFSAFSDKRLPAHPVLIALNELLSSRYAKAIVILILLAAGQVLLHSANAYGAVTTVQTHVTNSFVHFFQMDITWTLGVQLTVLLILTVCSRQKVSSTL